MQWQVHLPRKTTKFHVPTIAIKLVLQRYPNNLSNQALQINMDNFSATHILEIPIVYEITSK